MNQIGSWALKQNRFQKSDSTEILGTMFSSSSSSNLHVNERVQACRRAMYGLTSVGSVLQPRTVHWRQNPFIKPLDRLHCYTASSQYR